MNNIPVGICQCGCGRETNVPQKNNKSTGAVKGKPNSFVHGHNNGGERSPNWNGGRTTNSFYVRVTMPNHPRADHNGYVLEHILIAEKALGKPLPPGSQVHHHNEIKTDNSRGNIVVCQDEAYHKLLHRRKRALIICGHASHRKCSVCQQYDDSSNLYINKSICYHNSCLNERRRMADIAALENS